MSRAQQFWNKEYADASHLKLSSEPSSDLRDFCVWLKRFAGKDIFSTMRTLDIGCGNGRNSIYLIRDIRARRGVAFDISQSALDAAIALSPGLPISYLRRTIQEPLPVEDESVELVIDLMVSHVLREKDRQQFLDELARVLAPGGWYLIKTFMRDEDENAQQMIAEHGKLAREENAYIHPRLKAYEHVWSEDELTEFLEPYFTIHHVVRSHGHKRHGKRRSMVMYCEKKDEL